MRLLDRVFNGADTIYEQTVKAVDEAIAKYGADKYGETFSERNYTKIDTIEHLNHAVQHIYAFLAGDKQDDHLGHAIVRLMFAFDVEKRKDADIHE